MFAAKYAIRAANCAIRTVKAGLTDGAARGELGVDAGNTVNSA